MSEHVLYLKAEFKTDKHAVNALARLHELQRELETAYYFWEHNRYLEGFFDRKKNKFIHNVEERKEFWRLFTKQFPLATQYLGKLISGDCNAGLQGEFDIGTDDESVDQVKNFLYYSANVGECTDWTSLKTWIKTLPGCLAVGTADENNVDIFSTIQLEKV